MARKRDKKFWAVKHPDTGRFLIRRTAYCSRPRWRGELGISDVWEMKNWALGAARCTGGILTRIALVPVGEDS